MGNCVSEYKESSFRDSFGDDPSAFRVFIKRKNKFHQGWLKIADEEIIFTRGGGNIEVWPLPYLRRYGYTRAGIFFFESGRRCNSGAGLHSFQSHQAERIFQIVHLRIKHVEIRASRASSVASQRMNAVGPSSNANRVYPVQRFSSEGANGQAFSVQTSSQSFARVPSIPERRGRCKPTYAFSDSGAPSMTRSHLDFKDSWPNEPAPQDEEIVREHVLRAKKPSCMDPICRQRKYHSYVNVDLADQSHRLNFSQGNLHGPLSCGSSGGGMSASYCAPQPCTSSSDHLDPFLPSLSHQEAPFSQMSVSATAALGHSFGGSEGMRAGATHQLSYATLAMPESSSISSNRTTSVGQRSDCSSSSSAPTYPHPQLPLRPAKPPWPACIPSHIGSNLTCTHRNNSCSIPNGRECPGSRVPGAVVCAPVSSKTPSVPGAERVGVPGYRQQLQRVIAYNVGVSRPSISVTNAQHPRFVAVSKPL